MKIKMRVLLFSLFTVQVFAQGAGNALGFDGVNDYVEITHNDNLNMTEALTLDAWIKPAEPGKRSLFRVFTIGKPCQLSENGFY
ncbi:MAG: hypothetical protein WC703_01920 [Candidatus Neomarinimicrobiota bacterium]